MRHKTGISSHSKGSTTFSAHSKRKTTFSIKKPTDTHTHPKHTPRIRYNEYRMFETLETAQVAQAYKTRKLHKRHWCIGSHEWFQLASAVLQPLPRESSQLKYKDRDELTIIDG